MRGIKFRAFDDDEETRGMVYSDRKHSSDYWFTLDGGTVQCLLNSSYCDTFGDDHDAWEPLDNIMQYTGLKDKNGIEIYEGDIVLYDRNINDRFDKNTFEVKWDRDRYTLENTHTDYYDNISWELVEVVGNIYENPGSLISK